MVAELRELVGELRAMNAGFVATISGLKESLAARDARIGELEKLLEGSRRSGKRQAAPFSKGAPKDEPERPGRKSGGEHGRHGHRAVPVRVPDRELEAGLPSCCPGCGGTVVLEREEGQFQIDMPPVRPVVTRFRVQVGRCSGCRRRVQGRHPEQTSDALGAAGSQVGPETKAFAAWLHYELGLSFGKCAKVLARHGIEVTAGALCQAAQTTGELLAPIQAEIGRRLNEAKVVTADETGWRVNGRSAWLWLATADGLTVYNVAEGRGYAEACEVLDPDYAGVLVRDGWAPYRAFEQATHQSCCAHLLRRAVEMIDDNPGWARGTPRQVKGMLGEALAARDLTPAEQATVAADMIDRIELLADQAHPHDPNRRLVKHLHNERHALFTFLTHPGVPATNYLAEQAVRPAVVNRKVSGGNRTWRGALTQSRLMTVMRTAAQQGTDAIDWLTAFARAPGLGIPTLFTQ